MVRLVYKTPKWRASGAPFWQGRESYKLIEVESAESAAASALRAVDVRVPIAELTCDDECSAGPAAKSAPILGARATEAWIARDITGVSG